MRRRGQAMVELVLGLLVLIPILLGGIYFAEASTFRLKATEAATEPLWDATAYQQQSYTGSWNRTPAAVGVALAEANGRMRPKQGVFTKAARPKLACEAGAGLSAPIAIMAGIYADNGGMACGAELTVDPRGIARSFLEGSNGFFREPLANMARSFRFQQTESGKRFVMAVGDWGLTDLGGEGEECELTMGGCANQGFFDFAQATYESNRGAGTSSQAHTTFVQALLVVPPANVAAVTDFQMSFRGSESGFTQGVGPSEGAADWKTSPILGAWGASYAVRNNGFLGR
jgi:hypothetical protein